MSAAVLGIPERDHVDMAAVVVEAGHTKPRRVPVRNLAAPLCLGGH